MAETSVAGQLSPADGASNIDFSDYRARVSGTVALTSPAPDSNTPAPTAIEVEMEFVGYAASDGKFAVTLPDGADERRPWRIAVVDRVGRVLHSASHDTLADLNKAAASIDIGKLTSGTVPGPASSATRPPARLVGRVIRLDGASVPAGIQVVIKGRRRGGKTDEVVLADATGTGGYFAGERPAGLWDAAEATVPAAGESSTVALADGTFPRQVVVGISTLKDGVPLAPAPGTPRAPDQDELVSRSHLYSDDRGGTCVELTVPNRTLEEFDYFTVVRTTDPEVRGLTLGAGIDPLAPPRPPRPPFKAPPVVVPGDRQVLVRRAIERAASEADLSTVAGEALAVAAVKPVLDLRTYLDELAYSKLPPLKPTHAAGRGRLDGINALDWDNTPTVYQATTIAHGHVLHFKQQWNADGYSLGDLLYSLPLAPCQSKQIVTIDWERRESARRDESTTEVEELSASLARDRDISEVASSVLTEALSAHSEATSKSFARGGGVGVIIPPVGGLFGVSGGKSSSKSDAWQNSSRRLAAQTMQQLTDRTSQAASAVRSRRSTVVAEARQGERVGVESEVVTNHNHAHAMTVEYFEVLRHFRVSTDLVGVRECLFVPLLMSPFTMGKALRWKDLLVPRLPLDLRRGVRALERIDDEYANSDFPSGAYADDAITHLDGELQLDVLIARPPDPDGDKALDELETADIPADWELFARVLGVSKLEAYRMHRRTQGYFERTMSPALAQDVLERMDVRAHLDGAVTPVPLNMDVTLATPYRPRPLSGPRTVTLSVRLNPTPATPHNLVRRRVTHIEIRPALVISGGTSGFLPAGSRAVVRAAAVRYRTRHFASSMFSSRGVLNDLVDNSVLLATDLSPDELRNPRAEDAEIATRLIRHLNDRLEIFHRAIWLGMDSERRFLLLDGFLGPGNERSIASMVENQLIGIVGNSLVLPVAPGFILDPVLREALAPADANGNGNGKPIPLDERDGPAELVRLYQPLTPEPPRRFSLPTKGVFAEAVLGACNSCEVIDETRFWRWSEEPCTDQPTPILPVSADTRRTEPLPTAPTDFAAPIINLQNAPAAPDPQGFAALMQILGRPDLFRDITGLNQNQLNALAGLQAALSAAQGFGQGAAQLATTGAGIRARERQFAAIKDAVKEKLITPEVASKLFETALTGVAPKDEGKKTKEKANDAEKKLDVIKKAGDAGQVDQPTSMDLATRALQHLVDDGQTIGPAELETLARAAGDSGSNLKFTRPSGEMIEATTLPDEASSGAPGLQFASFTPDGELVGNAFAAFMLKYARTWTKFKTDVVANAMSEHVLWNGRMESDPALLPRLEDYYRATELPEANVAGWALRAAQDNDKYAWSAPFISYVVQQAELANPGTEGKFQRSFRHAVYIHAAKQNRASRDALNPFWLFDIDEKEPEEGDFLCKNRPNKTVTFATIPAGGFETHVDIVVAVDRANNELTTLGGNLSSTVSERTVKTTNGFVTTNSATKAQGRYFAVLKVRTWLTDDIVGGETI